MSLENHFPHKKLELDISMAPRETSETQPLKIPGQEDSQGAQEFLCLPQAPGKSQLDTLGQSKG